MRLNALLLLLVFLLPVNAWADFAAWTESFAERAHKAGIDRRVLDEAFKEVRYLPRVIELDRRQPSSILSFVEYRQRVAPRGRIEKGMERLAEQSRLLERVKERYRVDSEILVALWGVETDFGRNAGGFSLVDALATLAYDGRRGEFFEGELLTLLRILSEGHVPVDEMQGSWAGAMGQVQFMPSTFQGYAVDFDGDGRKDIWGNVEDALASAANYLARSGWEFGEPVYLPVRIDGAETLPEGLDVQKPVGEWLSLGVTPVEQGVSAQKSASLLRPDGDEGPAFLVFENFRVLRKWNRSTSFALTVGHIAEAIDAGR